MERVLSQDERIRRAEEIYARRQLENSIRRSATVNLEGNYRNNLTKKLVIQCIICIAIYSTFFALKNIPNLVSQKVMYKISDILEYDINIQKVYEDVNAFIEKKEEKSEEQTNELFQETLSATENNTENVEENQTENQVEEVQDSNEVIENKTFTQETTQEPVKELSQMEIDADYIKSNYSLIKPLEGEITSRFGLRNPSVPTVPKNHTGIDIARVQGTIIVSAMEGDVILVSSQGDLR